MEALDSVELLGFSASLLIVASLVMRSMVSLRLIGLAGSLTFIAYGLVLGAWPVVVTNTATTAIHLVRLRSLATDGRTRSGPGHDPDADPEPEVELYVMTPAPAC